MKDKEEKSALYFCLDALGSSDLFFANTWSSFFQVLTAVHLVPHLFSSLCGLFFKGLFWKFNQLLFVSV